MDRGENGVEHALHYLDDYLFFGVTATDQCEQALHRALPTGKRLRVPVSQKKVECPTARLPFLRILLDTDRMEVQLPDNKLQVVPVEVINLRVGKKK